MPHTSKKNDEEYSNSLRYTSASCQKKCVRELSYVQPTRISAPDEKNEFRSHNDETTKKTSINNKYQPVYNIREISAVCNSISSLGLGWNLDRSQNRIIKSPNLSKHIATQRHSLDTATNSNLNIVREAVNNNPAKGYGSYVYI